MPRSSAAIKVVVRGAERSELHADHDVVPVAAPQGLADEELVVPMAIAEAPDDETATAILLQLGSLGNVRTQTMRAFDTEEMSGIIAKTA